MRLGDWMGWIKSLILDLRPSFRTNACFSMIYWFMIIIDCNCANEPARRDQPRGKLNDHAPTQHHQSSYQKALPWKSSHQWVQKIVFQGTHSFPPLYSKLHRQKEVRKGRGFKRTLAWGVGKGGWGPQEQQAGDLTPEISANCTCRVAWREQRMIKEHYSDQSLFQELAWLRRESSFYLFFWHSSSRNCFLICRVLTCFWYLVRSSFFCCANILLLIIFKVIL